MFPIYPYLNINDLNLDYLLRTVRALETEIKNFVNFNAIKYADPLAWNITTQYEGNTVVIDPATGIAYLSTQAVPNGVAITNTNYWTAIFDMSVFFAEIGDLNDLLTTQKDNLVDAINEVLLTASNVKSYNTVNSMINDDNLTSNTIALTCGYHAENDGGAAKYYISDTAPAIPHYYETLNNGKYAVLICENGLLNVKQFGAYGDDSHDDTQAIKSAINAAGGSYNITFPTLDGADIAYNILIPAGKYIVSEEIRINKNNIRIKGHGVLNTVIKCSDSAIIESIFTFTGAYGCSLEDIQLNGNVPRYSTVNHNPVNYGACCGLWVDQIAYCTFTNVMICNTRNQGMRWCHVWQDEFNNIMIYHTSGYGTTANDKYYGAAILHSLACQLDTTFNPSASVKTSESNQVTINRLEVSGLMGATFKVMNDQYNSVVQNITFNDVIEENDPFTGLNLSDLPPCFAVNAWDFEGGNYYVTPAVFESEININNHYVYYHNYTFNSPKRFYSIACDHVHISNSIIFEAKTDGTYSAIDVYCYCQTATGAPDVDLHVIEENYSSDSTKNFDYIVVCQNLYGVNCPVMGKVRFTVHGYTNAYNVSDIIQNYSIFAGLVAIQNTIYQCDGATPA